MNEQCPRCGNTTWYGPAEVVWDGKPFYYYECRKCSALMSFPGRPANAATSRN